MVLVAFFIGLTTSSKHKRRLWTVAVVVTAVAIFTLFNGTRQLAIGLLLLPFVASMFSKGSSRDQHRLSVVRLVAFGLVAIVMLTSMYGARQRLQETDPVTALLDEMSSSEGLREMFTEEPLNYGETLVDVVQVFPDRHDFLWAYSIRRSLLFLFPSGDFKPKDPNIIIGEMLGASEGTTVPPSLPGEGYVTLGGVGGAFVLCFLYGLAMAGLAHAQRHWPVFLVVVSLSTEEGLLILRGQLYEVVARSAIVFLLVAIVVAIARVRFRRKTAYKSRSAEMAIASSPVP